MSATSISAACRRSSPVTWPGAAPSTRGSCRASSDKTASRSGSARGAHLVVYPVRGGALINVVAIVAGQWNRPGWNEAGSPGEIAAAFDARRWSTAARMIIGAADNWRKWALFTVDGVPPADGPVALVGDASSCDAALRSARRGDGDRGRSRAGGLPVAPAGNATEAFRQYAALRQARVAHVKRTTWQSGAIYHLSAPVALARNLTMKVLGGRRLLSQRDWLYDWPPGSGAQ